MISIRRVAGFVLLGFLLIPGYVSGQGFPNVVQTPGELLTPLLAPNQGRTAVIAYHNGWLYTVPEIPSSQSGSDYQVRRWNISNLSNVTVEEVLGETEHPVMAHGYLKIGDYLCLGDNWPNEAPFSFRAISPNVNQRTTTPGLIGPYARGNLYQPWDINTYWSYNPDEIDDLAVLSKNGETLATWDHIAETGVIGHPFIVGNLLIFASDQSRTGVATYDISDPTNPRLLDVLKTGGPGGYWPELWGGDGRLYVVFPYREPTAGMRVVEVTDPENIRFISDISLPGDAAMYVQFQDNHAFLGSHKVDMNTLSSVLVFDGYNRGVDTSQFLLPIGNLVATGGIGEYQGLAVWAHQAAPDTQGPTVGYHIPKVGETNYPTSASISLLIHETLESPTITVGENFIVRPVGGSPIAGRAVFSFGDILTFTPDSDLLSDTTYEVVIPSGGIKDVAGNGIEGYSFTFSTGSEVEGNQPPVIEDFSSSAYPVAPDESVTLLASASDPEDGDLEYRFDFGDGTPRTAWSSSSSTSYSYSVQGHYPAKVQVRDEEGLIETAILSITVTSETAAQPPARSSSVTIDETRRRIWTVNPDNNTITAVDADTLEVEFETTVAEEPRSVAIDSSGNAWVACHKGDQIDVVSPAGSIINSVSLDYGDGPFGILPSLDGEMLYVSLFNSGEVIRVASATGTVSGRLSLGPTPRAMALSPDGSTLYISRFISAKDFAEVWEVSTSNLTLSRTFRLDKLGGDDHRDTTAEGKGAPNYLAGLAVSPNGSRLLVTSTKVNSEKGLLTGPDLDPDNTVRNLLSVIDTSNGEALHAIDIDNSESASSVCFSPLGDYFFVTLQGNNDIIVFDYFSLDDSSGLGGFVSRQKIGRAPQGLCVDPATDRLFAKNYLSRDLTVFELEGFNSRGEADFPQSTISTVETESLDPQILLGKQIFYHGSDPRMSGEGYLSCATCHIDGGHDGRTWDFTGRGEGLRNTTSLNGRSGMGQGNVHWTANFDEIQDFEHDIRGPFGGLGFLSDSDFANTDTPGGSPKAGLNADLDALAAYVTSLSHESIPKSPHRETNGDLTADATAGRLVFQSSGCAACHSGSEMTDGTLHNVGTLRTTSGMRLGGDLPGIETPTLRGLWESAPYLHDGSAEELADVFTQAGGTVIQGETGTPTGNSSIVSQWTDLNNDATVRGGAYAEIWDGGHLIFSNVDGGSGGTGALEIRYSSGYTSATIVVEVNGVIHRITSHPTGNVPDWRYVNWASLRVEGVAFNSGTNNTIDIYVEDPTWLAFGVDEITVSTSDDLALASPHRLVSDLLATDRNNLLAYLRQLDGSPVESIDLPTPNSPTNLQITDAETDSPLIQWTASPGATLYLIHRSSSDSFETATIVGETTTSSFRDEGAGNGEFYYWVTASNSTGTSSPSSSLLRSEFEPQPDVLAQPDLSIGPKRRDLIGNGEYSGRQMYTKAIKRRKGGKAFLMVENDTTPDGVSLSATPGSRNLKVKYFHLKRGRTNVTSAISSGKLELPDMSASVGEMFLIRYRHKKGGRKFILSTRGQSIAPPGNRDKARLRLLIR
ncbi:MAG: hypothetical protein CMO55_18895 [Verrucomicrobiales bacterium]|nr:hypothetical protein [Verrucomicrobiales bacterium]